jgi:hypothetical protein
MAVHGPNIDWWGVRIAVNELLTRKLQLPISSPEEAFNMLYAAHQEGQYPRPGYEARPLPYRNNNPDGIPSTGAITDLPAALLDVIFEFFLNFG